MISLVLVFLVVKLDVFNEVNRNSYENWLYNHNVVIKESLKNQNRLIMIPSWLDIVFVHIFTEHTLKCRNQSLYGWVII